MTSVTTVPWGNPLSAEDYFAFQTPDDGQRYELIDGVFFVSPSPFLPHQILSAELITLLSAACPADLLVLHAPLDVRLSSGTVVQPDVLVVRSDDARGERLAGVPLLAIEILSDSTRGTDLLLKYHHYERAGVPSYWVVDPKTREIRVWELQAGEYGQAVHADLRATPLVVDRPFPVTLRLAH